jgi:hypothetical protein
MDSYYSLEALAIATGLPRTYLRQLTVAGEIPALDVNGRLRFDIGQVRSALLRLAERGAGDGQ